MDCPGEQFQCSNGTCLDKSYRCNSLIDCHPDGNDEFGCGMFILLLLIKIFIKNT